MDGLPGRREKWSESNEEPVRRSLPRSFRPTLCPSTSSLTRPLHGLIESGRMLLPSGYSSPDVYVRELSAFLTSELFTLATVRRLNHLLIQRPHR